jgi:Cu(I)/Ag(I) efflux system periplasmic protein CusF
MTMTRRFALHVLVAGMLWAVAAQAGVLGHAAAPPANGALRLVHEGHGVAAKGSGTVNSVDQGQHRVNLSHGSIPALGWPAMTMEFPVSPEVDLSAVKAGMRVNFTLIRDSTGAYQVDAIEALSAH